MMFQTGTESKRNKTETKFETLLDAYCVYIHLIKLGKCLSKLIISQKEVAN